MYDTIETNASGRKAPRYLNLELLAAIIAGLATLALIWSLMSPTINMPIVVASGLIFTLSVGIMLRMLLDPDSVRARQSDAILQLSSSTLDLMKDGLTPEAAQSICELLLPSTAAVAVAITDRETIMGYAGYLAASNPTGCDIHTQATIDSLSDGNVRILRSSEEIGFKTGTVAINGAIIVPLVVGENVEGVLKFYYRSAKKISETQKSIAVGFGRLISTQMAAVEMETQRKLATSMELKMLQSQINPHFLFNTINTIASLIRTDPAKARVLLRDFAVFYRRTLEDSSERIMLSRELEQTMRYFSFEVARFGEDRVALYVGAGPELEDMMVPPFMLQPLVENAVKHAMPSEGKLNIFITVEADGPDVLVTVADDGVGMDEETCHNIMHPASSTGMGIAVKNVHDRLQGFFGANAEMKVESELGQGTTITLRFPDCALPLINSTEELA